VRILCATILDRVFASSYALSSISTRQKEQIMIRNLKALGLAFLAVFAMSAIAVSAAQAEGVDSLTPASYPAWLTGEVEENQVYTTNTGMKTECSGGSAQATIEKAGVGDTSVTVTDIKATGCVTKLGTSTMPATIDMTGCDSVFSGGKTDPEDSTHYTNATVAINCPVGVTGPDVTTFTNATNHTAGTALCHLTVWSSITAGSITNTNLATSPNTVTVKSVGITNNVTRSGSIICGNPTTSVYNGSTIIKAYKDEGLQADGTTPKEGAQIGLTVSHL
jgi:hypothetical protein